MIGADPATDGPGLSGAPVAYLPSDVDAAALAAAVRAAAAGLIVLDPTVAGATGVHAHARTSESAETLTAREREVLLLVAEGLPNKAIARELGISEHTAKFHVGSLLGKLGAASRTEAVTLATRRGILPGLDTPGSSPPACASPPRSAPPAAPRSSVASTGSRSGRGRTTSSAGR